MEKTVLRKNLLAKLATFSPQVLQQAGHSAWNILYQQDFWHRADAVLAYNALNTEFSSLALLNKVLQTKRALFLPRVEQKTMTFYRVYDINNQEQHRLGFYQPTAQSPLFNLNDWQFPLLIAPAIGANARGFRLGRGGGFYDRYLASTHTQKLTCVVVVNSLCVCQFTEDVFDKPFQYILTEQYLRQVG